MQDLHVEEVAMSETVKSKLVDKSGDKNANIAKLPKIVIPKFTGNYTEWTTFHDLFKSLVHDTDMDKVIKMQYLKGLLGGEAEQLVRNFIISSANYDKCWNTLIERYNNKRYLCNTILKRLFSQRSSNSESASFLKEILDNTTECIGALSNLGVDVSTWDLIIIYMTSLKLDPESRKQWELESANITGNELPNFEAFHEFLTKRFRALEFVDTGSSSNKSRVAPRSFHVAEEANVSVTCKFCKEQHKLVHCKAFENEEVSARRVFIEKQRLCFNCLGDGHSANQCRCRVSCRVCRRRHHTSLHLTGDTDSKPVAIASSNSSADSSSGEEAPVACFASGGVAPQNQVLLATALIKAETKNGDTQIIRAVLDQGSQASFITEATAQHLGLTKTPVRGVISGVGGRHNILAKSRVKLNISSMHEDFQNIKLSLDAYVLKSITTLRPSKQVIAAEWVCNLPLADPGYNTPSRIDLLLGAEVVGQVMRAGIQKQGSLLAQHTSLGWILSGVAGSNSNKQATNLIAMHQMCVEEDNQLKEFWNLKAETKAKTIKPILTEEETRREKFCAETTGGDEDGRNNEELSCKLEDLKAKEKLAEKKLNKATELKAKGVGVLEDYLHLDHTESVPEKEVNNTKVSSVAARVNNNDETLESTTKLNMEMVNHQILKTERDKRRRESSNSEELQAEIKETGKGMDKEDGVKLKTNEAVKQWGLTWNRRSDAHQDTVSLPQLEEPVTKKVFISDTSQRSDPLGWIASTVIVKNINIQKLWTSEIEWNEKVPSKNLEEWLTYRSELPVPSSMRNNHQRTFVANRVSEILTALDSHQWLHIRSKQNPADGASRELDSLELVNDVLWFNGLEVLQKKEVNYDSKKNEETNIEEIKVHFVRNTHKLWEQSTNRDKLIRVVEHCSRHMTWKKRKKNINQGFLTTQKQKAALEMCIKQCQKEKSTERIADVKKSGSGKAMKIRGPFKQTYQNKLLNPDVDDKQRWRVGKRIDITYRSDDGLFKLKAVEDSVLVSKEELPPYRWLLGRVITKHPGPDNITRVVSLRTKSSVMKRPTSKLCILPNTA